MRHATVSALCLAAAGCVSSSDIELLHREITDVTRQVDTLARQSSGKEDLRAMSQKAAEQNSQVLRSNADIQLRLEELSGQIESLGASLDATSQRLEALSNELAAARAGLAVAPVPPGGALVAGAAAGAAATSGSSEPAQLYSSAYEDYLRGNFDLAVQGFREYMTRFPATELTDNALYWVGECQYSKREFQPAVESFTQLLNTYKTSDKAAAALLKKGLAYLELSDRSQAVINLQYVLYEHPGTKEAELARNRLVSLGIKVK